MTDEKTPEEGTETPKKGTGKTELLVADRCQERALKILDKTYFETDMDKYIEELGKRATELYRQVQTVAKRE